MELTEKQDDSEIKVECTWGEGPDVLVSIKNHPMILASDVINKDRFTHGVVKDAWLDLTQEQARNLANELLIASEYAKALEDSAKEFFSLQEQNLK